MPSPTDRVILERLEAADHDRLVSLWTAAGLEHKPRGRDSRPAFERQLGLGMVAYFGLFRDGELLGSVLASHDGRKGWINRLAVAPAHRRKGLARRLIVAAEEWLASQGLEIYACLVEGWNRGSRDAFAACGYEPYPGVVYLTKRRHPEV
ncbi:MAG TPA: GNAT family N-acetyltransferase [bacterium]|nr:GNAT family N-acetyltransferase [bacterium]